MKTRKLNKIWNGLATLRDYEISYIEKGGRMKLIYEDQFMMLTPENYKEKIFRCHQKEFQSKFGSGKTYKLVDLKWKPEGDKRDEIEFR